MWPVKLIMNWKGNLGEIPRTVHEYTFLFYTIKVICMKILWPKIRIQSQKVPDPDPRH
jgi:hypothetical protein